MEPVFIRYTDSGCVTLSPWQPRRRQTSSTQAPTCGNQSDTSIPLRPCLANVRGEAGRQRLAVEAGEVGLGVERVDVARPAGHEEEDDALGRRLVVRPLRRE